MEDIKKLVTTAQNLFKHKIEEILAAGGLSEEQYLRFLTCQYHLTQGVQKHFYRVASHPDMASKKSLREWLVQFAHEEEFHFKLAQNDAQKLGKEILPQPLDVKLWWLYFDSVIEDSPFIRLGGTCILENISDGASQEIDKMLSQSSFLNKDNTRFLTIHRHSANLAHGDQVLEKLGAANLSANELEDIKTGCKTATVFYLRLMGWMLSGEVTSG